MDRFLSFYRILYIKAKADLSAAQILYTKFNEGDTELDIEVICFHLQQCAEKLLKAVLSKKEIYYPKVHDLETLLNITKEHNILINTDWDLLIELNDYAVEGRYAVMHDDLQNIQSVFIIIEKLMEDISAVIDLK